VPIAAFLDRDNTIVDQSVSFINSAKHMELADFLPGAVDALRRLQSIGYQLHVVTNQGGVGMGYLTQIELCRIHLVLFQRLEHEGVRLNSIKSCHHRPDAGCDCRKPKPGMLLSIAKRFGVDLANSIMIGDHPTDVEAGQAAGCRAYLLRRWQDLDLTRPEPVASEPA
jgi:D-glycero-D-manno-heptose 1,7-bisphosphate phosphatase